MAKPPTKKLTTTATASADKNKKSPNTTSSPSKKAAASPNNKKTKSPTSATTTSPSNENAASPNKKKNKTTAPPQSTKISNTLDVILPHSLGSSGGGGDCTVLVQIDPQDSSTLDFEGSTGVIGRFQVDSHGIILDLKGSQYAGQIVPGPTAMVASLQYDTNHQQQLKLEAIVDEFCPLVKTQDIMAKLDGQIIKGTMDESYQLQEEDVNILARQEQQQEKNSQKQKNSSTANKKTATTRTKRASSTSTSAAAKKSKTSSGGGGARVAANKRQKVSLGRKK